MSITTDVLDENFLQSTLSVPALVLSSDGIIEQVNFLATKVFNQDVDEISDKPASDYFLDQDDYRWISEGGDWILSNEIIRKRW